MSPPSPRKTVSLSVLTQNKTLTTKLRCPPVYADPVFPADVSVGSYHLTGFILIAAALCTGLVKYVGGDYVVAVCKPIREQKVAVVCCMLRASVFSPDFTDLPWVFHCPVLDKHTAVSSDRAIT